MNAAIEALNRAAAAWWPHLLHATWQSTLVAAMFLAAVRVGRRWPAHVRYALLLIALVKFAIPPMLPLPTGLFSRFGPTITLEAAKPASQDALADGADDSHDAAGARTALQSLERVSWRGWLLLAHVCGAVVVMVGLGVQLSSVAGMSRRARRFARGPLCDYVEELSRKIGLRRRVRLLVSPEPVSPMAFGLLRPSVLVPASLFHDVPRPQMETILIHELAHHRRGDIWASWFQALLNVAWWFNPVFWLLSRAISRTREDCCDDLLLSRKLTTDGTYCQALLKVASELRRRLLPEPASGFAHRAHPLGERIKRIMDPRLHRASKLSLVAAALLVLVAGLVLPGLRSGTATPQAAAPLLAASDRAAEDEEARLLWPSAAALADEAWTLRGGWRYGVPVGGARLYSAMLTAMPEARRAGDACDAGISVLEALETQCRAGRQSVPFGQWASLDDWPPCGRTGHGQPRQSDGHLLDVYLNMGPVVDGVSIPVVFGLDQEALRQLAEPTILCGENLKPLKLHAEPLLPPHADPGDIRLPQGDGAGTRLAQGGGKLIPTNSVNVAEAAQDLETKQPTTVTHQKPQRIAPDWTADPAGLPVLVTVDGSLARVQLETIGSNGATGMLVEQAGESRLFDSVSFVIAEVHDGTGLGWLDLYDWADAYGYDSTEPWAPYVFVGGVGLVPEAATLLSLAAGALVLLRRRRRSA